MVKELRRIINVFHNKFSKTYQEMRARHLRERKKFLKERRVKIEAKYRIDHLVVHRSREMQSDC